MSLTNILCVWREIEGNLLDPYFFGDLGKRGMNKKFKEKWNFLKYERKRKEKCVEVFFSIKFTRVFYNSSLRSSSSPPVGGGAPPCP